MSGYDLMSQGLDRIGKGWDKSNQYSTVDLAGTLAKLFSKKKTNDPQYQIVQDTNPNQQAYEQKSVVVPNGTATPEIQNILSNAGVNAGNVNLGSNTPTDQQTLNTIQSAGVYVPGVSPERTQTHFEPVQNSNSQTGQDNQGGFDISQLSANNPLRGVIPTNQGFIQRKVRPETIAAALQWEQDNQQNDLAKQLSDLEFQAKKGAYITLDQATLEQIPEKYRGYYQVGQTVPRQDLIAMIPQTTTPTGYDTVTAQSLAKGLYDKNPYKQTLLNLPEGTDPKVIQDLIDKANAAQMSLDDLYKQSSGGSDRGNTDLKNQYQGVLSAYDKYKNGIVARKDGSVPMQMVDWLQQPEQKGMLDIYNQFTGNTVQGFQYPYNKNPNNPTDQQVKKLIADNKGVATAIFSAIPKNSGVSDKVLIALVNRYNTDHKTNYTADQWIAAYSQGVASPKFLK